MKKDSYTLAFVNNFKSIKLLFCRYPKFFLIFSASAIYSALTPYVYLFFSTRLINELNSLNMSMVWRWVIYLFVITVFLEILGSKLSHIESYYNSIFESDRESIFTEKLMSLNYKDVDTSSTFDVLSQIYMNEQYAGYGLHKSVEIYKCIISVFSSIGGSVILCFSLFVSKVHNNEWEFLNHYLFIVVIIMAMVFVSVISPIISNKAKAYWANKVGQANLINRLYSFFGFLAYESPRAYDIRMYNQDKMCEKGFREFNVFKPGGEIANCAKGYMGLGLALSVAISYIVTWLIYGFVCMKAWAGAYEIGNVAQYLGALTALSSAISELLVIVGDIKTNSNFLDIVFSFLDIPDNVQEGQQFNISMDCDYIIEFKSVSFKYANATDWALRDVNCTISKGKHIAIVGENGSGKTTFVKLLCRLYEPVEGEILLNGKNINEYSFESYIQFVSVVFQDCNLISQPIKNNISVSEQSNVVGVWKCLEMADASNYVKELTSQLNTYLYKDYDIEGINLSGGEEQKIAIARALYKSNSLLILDEPTAALDPVSESNLYKNLNNVDVSKTMLFISHRLSSCVFCDEIFVFDEGKLVQRGNHRKLVAEEGKYQVLWNAQAQYYK